MVDNAYALAQWSQALVTAVTAEDDVTRAHARHRSAAWQRVVTGLRSGSVRLGSRTPVRGLPAWVTPEVVRGGFATGQPAAAGPLSVFERELAAQAGLPEERGAVFEHCLTESGLRRLWAVLDGGRFDVDLPEAAAVLVVAWLVRAGDVRSALAVVDALRPHAATVRFLPASVSVPERDPEIVWRESAGDVAAALRRRTPPTQVLRMNDVLAAWNPFADRLLAQWLTVTTDGRVDGPFSDGWLRAGRELLDEYDRLACRRVPPRRHASPKENAAALRLALAAVVGGRELTPRERGRVLGAVEAMSARRGAPGTPALGELRARQRAQASLPTVASLAHLAADRLAPAPPGAGLEDLTPFAAPVTEAESATTTLPAGTAMPRAVQRTLLRTKAGTLRQLVDDGVITSAELLATMVPQLTAQVVADQYDDPVLRVLVARTYEAFRRRRSLLLLHLQQQVRPEELPWVAATAARRRTTDATRDVARGTLLRLADEAVTHWPGAILPNPLVAELTTLAAAAGARVPLVEEIAADIFMGRFSPKFATTFILAASALGGSRYARYYRVSDDDLARVRRARRPEQAFGELCAERADTPGHRWCVVCNGMIVEQAQILTTHNLASLVAVGLTPRHGWRQAAEGAYGRAADLMTRLKGNPRPQRMLKDLAYAWRQMVFHLSQLDEAGQSAFLEWATADASRRSAFAGDRLLDLLDGLARPGARPTLLGWGHGQHWLLEVTPRVVDQRVRNRVIEYLELASSFDAQRQYQAIAPVNVAHAVIYQWEDNFPEGLDTTNLDARVYSAAEASSLGRYQSAWETALAALTEDDPELEAVHAMAEWEALRQAAESALGVFMERGYLAEDREVR